MRRAVLLPLAAACLAVAPAAEPHHSISVIDTSKAVWLTGVVVRYKPGAPHALLEVDATGPDGVQGRWLAEGPFPGRMARIIELYGGTVDGFLKPGDVIDLCGFRPKPEYPLERGYAAQEPDRARFIHAELLVMADGRMRAWGPYGKLDNCIRGRDTSRDWQSFLNRDPLAHELWCAGLRQASTPSTAPAGFVEDVNRSLASPCR